MPQGFEKHQLPVFISNNDSTMFFITSGQPGATFPTHKHSKDTGLHTIVGGSIELNQMVLEVGDWFYVPAAAIIVSGREHWLYHSPWLRSK
jgi:hypothetical protein